MKLTFKIDQGPYFGMMTLGAKLPEGYNNDPVSFSGTLDFTVDECIKVINSCPSVIAQILSSVKKSTPVMPTNIGGFTNPQSRSFTTRPRPYYGFPNTNASDIENLHKFQYIETDPANGYIVTTTNPVTRTILTNELMAAGILAQTYEIKRSDDSIMITTVGKLLDKIFLRNHHDWIVIPEEVITSSPFMVNHDFMGNNPKVTFLKTSLELSDYVAKMKANIDYKPPITE